MALFSIRIFSSKYPSFGQTNYFDLLNLENPPSLIHFCVIFVTASFLTPLFFWGGSLFNFPPPHPSQATHTSPRSWSLNPWRRPQMGSMRRCTSTHRPPWRSWTGAAVFFLLEFKTLPENEGWWEWGKTAKCINIPYTLRNLTNDNGKCVVSFWDGLFSGAMLVSGSVSPTKDGDFPACHVGFRGCTQKFDQKNP